MDNVISTIKMQTNIEDEVLIEEIYKSCMCDMVKTIMELMNIKDVAASQSKIPSEFDNMREILAEKEQIYHELMNQKSGQK